ncbi:ybl77 [Escherichia coli]|uniref:Ybl77 n=1 Tax=Escherichia coli TaxID=562 RepID=A0A377D757_ECOLX|nr:ybl77 [Escherichia coli]
MAKVFTQEEREKIKGQVVELVRLSGRETLRATGSQDRCDKISDECFSPESWLPVAMYTTLVTGYSRLNRRVRTGKMLAKNSQGQR